VREDVAAGIADGTIRPDVAAEETDLRSSREKRHGSHNIAGGYHARSQASRSIWPRQPQRRGGLVARLRSGPAQVESPDEWRLDDAWVTLISVEMLGV
jgi:hypothetical protein